MLTNRIQSVWWLNPTWLFCVMGFVVTVAALLVPENLYAVLWGAPKYFTIDSAKLVFGCLILFALGSELPGLRPAHWIRRNEIVESLDLDFRMLLKLYRVSFWLCVLGYAVWASLAVQRGLNLGVLIAFLSGTHGISATLREDYLGNVPGFTTCTQFGVATAVLGSLIVRQEGWKKIRVSIVTVFLLAVLRALLNSERLAVIELAVPFLAIIVQFKWAPRARKAFARGAIKLFPVGGTVALYFVFAFFEYFRSWTTYYAGKTEYSFWTFVGCRLAGYYVTALNNGAFFMGRLHAPLHSPFFVLNFLWRFPLIKDVTDRLIGTPPEMNGYFAMLFRGANAEFNNGDGYFVPVMDFGTCGGLLYWFLTGLLCGVLYRLFKRGNAWGLCLYPVVFMGLVDIVRGIYWAGGRAIPGALFLLFSAFLLRFRQQREENTQISGCDRRPRTLSLA